MTDKLTLSLIGIYLLMVGSSLVEKQWNKSIYWLGAAILTYGVYRMK
mgnify:CR=1 FL=1